MPALAPQTLLTLLAPCSTLLANGAPPTGVWNSQNTRRGTQTLAGNSFLPMKAVELQIHHL